MRYQYVIRDAYKTALELAAGASHDTPSEVFEVDGQEAIALELKGTDDGGTATVTAYVTGSIDGETFETNQATGQLVGTAVLETSGSAKEEVAITSLTVKGLRCVRVEKVTVAGAKISELTIRFGRVL